MIKEIYKNIKNYENKNIVINGRIRSNRVSKNILFILLNDGSTISDIQLICKSINKNFIKLSKLKTGDILKFEGKVIATPNNKQKAEIEIIRIININPANEDYPLQKKEHSFEFLREISDLRVRTKTFQSVFRIRSCTSFAIHNYFKTNDFLYVNTPIITANDAEGAGESFIVTTNNNGDYENDFFGKKASLTVSGQLHLESFAQSFKKVYNFGPTFRAENSNTVKHAAEFWMIEQEAADQNLNELIDFIEKFIKYIVRYVLENCKYELEYCNENLDKNLLKKLENILNVKFDVIDYSEAIKILLAAKENNYDFENKNIEFGMDLATEHERYICEIYSNKPVFVTNYPKEIKAFYMKQNNDNKTVAATDLLIPYVGELVGGSLREDGYNKLIVRCNEMNIDSNSLKWYLDLRKEGYYQTSGFGLGFERLIMYLTGISNIRDVQAFSRTPKNLKF